MTKDLERLITILKLFDEIITLSEDRKLAIMIKKMRINVEAAMLMRRISEAKNVG
jgi:hypothetical protein